MGVLGRLCVGGFALVSRLGVSLCPNFSIVANRAKTKGDVVLNTVNLLLNGHTSDGTVGTKESQYIVRTRFSLSECNVRGFFSSRSVSCSTSSAVVQERLATTNGDHTFVGSAPIPLAHVERLKRRLISVRSRRRGLLLRGRSFRLGIISVVTRSTSRLGICRGRCCTCHGTGRLLRRLGTRVTGGHRGRRFVHFRRGRLSSTGLRRNRLRRLRRRTRALDRSRSVGATLCRTSDTLSKRGSDVLSGLGGTARRLRGVYSICPDVTSITNEVRDDCVRLGSVTRRVDDDMSRIRFSPGQLSTVGAHLSGLCALRRGFRIRAIARLVTAHSHVTRRLSRVSGNSRSVRRGRGRITTLLIGTRGRTTLLASVHRGSTGTVRGRVGNELVPLNVPGMEFRVTFTRGPLSKGNTSGIDFLFDTGGDARLRPIDRITSNNRVTHIVLSLGTVVDKTIGLPAVVFSRVSANMDKGVTRGVTSVVRRVKLRGQRMLSVARLPRVTTGNDRRCGILGRRGRGKAVSRVGRLGGRRHVRRVTRVLDNDSVARTTLTGTGRLLEV